MSHIARILVPIHDCRDEYPSLDHALWLASSYGASLLVAGAVDRQRFVTMLGAPPPGPSGVLENKALDEFRACLLEAIEGLVARAKQLGITVERTVIEKRYPEGLVRLTRQCDIMVEWELHRRTLVERKLFPESDIYTDACCPILVTKSEPSALSPPLLLYSRSEQANRGLRWLTQLVYSTESPHLRVLVLFRGDEEEDVLSREVDAFTTAHGVEAEIEAVPYHDGFLKAIELAKELRPGTVAMPTYSFARPLRLRMQGIDEQALQEIPASVLLFP